jgi:uncharacterized membrane protein
MATTETEVKPDSAKPDGVKHELLKFKLGHQPTRHPVNQVHHDEATLGERMADKIAAGIGSWTFLIVQTIAVILWLAVNSYWLYLNLTKQAPDPYPFILLNLLFSVQAAYTGPVLLLAGNRQSQKDRLTLEHAAAEADKADQQNQEILLGIARTAEQNQQILLEIQKTSRRSEDILREIQNTASQNRQILQHLEAQATNLRTD